MAGEFRGCLELVKFVLQHLVGMNDYRVRLGLRDPDSDKYVGATRTGTRPRRPVASVLQDSGVTFIDEPGEAAFYGPKVDFVVNDCIGREWQLGTVQLDYNLPERFELEYIGADNQPTGR